MDKAKLSTFIRLGSKLRLKGIGLLEDDEGNTCALGAAFHAKSGMSPREYGKMVEVSDKVSEMFPQLKNKIIFHIDDYFEERQYTLKQIIIYFNDLLKWPREQIANWLEEKGY